MATKEADKLFARNDDVEAKVHKDDTKWVARECETWTSRISSKRF